jgi:hypothetical protein
MSLEDVVEEWSGTTSRSGAKMNRLEHRDKA